MFQRPRNILVIYTKTFYKQIVISIIAVVLLFTTIGIITTTKPASRLSSSVFSTWTSNMDQSIFTVLYGIENNAFGVLHDANTTQPSLTKLLFHVVTSVKMNDLKSFLAHEIPGFSTYENKIIIAGEGMGELSGLSHESGPPLEDVLQDRKAVTGTEKELEEQAPKTGLTANGKKVLFLYNSHNRESFLPHLPEVTNTDGAYHQEINITKVSERIAKTLESYGIGSYVDHTDIMGVLHEKGWKYWKSYEASRPVVQEALGTHKGVQYVMDIHRDSMPHDATTKEIDGKSFAKILFVIGADNKNYEKNLAFATTLHYAMEEKYPGLSKGIITKEGPSNNGVYNQDLSDKALLLEIGGYENTLEEMYRSADVIAEIFSSYYLEAEQVSSEGGM